MCHRYTRLILVILNIIKMYKLLNIANLLVDLRSIESDLNYF